MRRDEQLDDLIRENRELAIKLEVYRQGEASRKAEVVRLTALLESAQVRLKDEASAYSSLAASYEAMKLQVRDFMDFIGCVHLWSVGQPTALEIRESCAKILDKYAAVTGWVENRKSEGK